MPIELPLEPCLRLRNGQWQLLSESAADVRLRPDEGKLLRIRVTAEPPVRVAVPPAELGK